MKKLLSIILIIVFLFLTYPLIVSASYEIQLKNGSSYVTHYYWEEGGQIKFHYYGGVIGFQKNIVKVIKKSDAPVIVPREEPFREEDADESKDKPGGKDIPEEGSDEELSFKNKKIFLDRQLKDALERYRDAKKSKNKEMISTEYRKASNISAELEGLKKEVKERYNWNLPEWWHSDSE